MLDSEELAELKTEILTKGIRFDEKGSFRKTGAGPVGQYIVLPGENVTTAPIYGVSKDHFVIKEKNSSFYIEWKGQKVPVDLVDKPDFYSEKNSSGIEHSKIAKIHGKECLATTLYSKCILFERNEECKFCGIDSNAEKKNKIVKKEPKMLLETIERAENNFDHILLTSGIPNEEDYGAEILAEATKKIKEEYDYPVHVQIVAVGRDELEELYASGVDTIGIHLEAWDPQVLDKIIPGKAKMGRKKFLTSMKAAVEIFGKNQVNSYMLAGLGEDHDKMIEGVEKIADTGSIPFLTPFRPIPGTELEDRNLPRTNYMKKLYKDSASVLSKKNIEPKASKAGCVRCGACSAIKEYMKTIK